MKNNTKPQRDPEFLLEQLGSDFQLRHRGEDTAIFINESVALLWELCDGQRTLGSIKKMLEEAYPDVAAQIDADVDKAISILVGHNALTG